MYFNKTPEALAALWPSLLWRVDTRDPVIYLTFDDGPTPGVTDWVLDQLSRFGARATFFCLGKQVELHPGLYEQILLAGHGTGNHSYSHVNGRKVSQSTYLLDVQRAANQIRSPLFRPPYGRLTRSLIKKLQVDYRIVMWDLLTGDFDQKTTTQKGARKTIENARPGSIIVCHDSLKASRKLIKMLPVILEQLTDRGFAFHSLSESSL